MNRKGIALILSFIVIAVLTTLGIVMLSRSVSERNIALRNLESTQAFWLAEAGVNRALSELRTVYDTSGSNLWLTSMGAGQYSADVEITGSTRTVTAHGYIPSQASPRVERIIVAVMKKKVPTDFYENAIYGAGDIVINGASYSVDGKIRFGDSINIPTNPPPPNVTDTVTSDPSIKPLALLDFNQLRAISQSQGNYHTSSQLNGPFPTSFWYDEALGVPNVVFLEGSFNLKGNDVVGGFYVVGGQVIYDATLAGNVTVNGCIYTRGNFTTKGGGNALNIDGGVWAGGETTINGNTKITYNQTYMNAIKALNINTNVQVISWRDAQNPYQLTP